MPLDDNINRTPIYNGGSFAYQLRDAVVQYFGKYTL